jgi:hypothetical protein
MAKKEGQEDMIKFGFPPKFIQGGGGVPKLWVLGAFGAPDPVWGRSGRGLCLGFMCPKQLWQSPTIGDPVMESHNLPTENLSDWESNPDLPRSERS